MAIRLSNTAASAAADGVGNLMDSGYLRIYDGTIPTNANTAVGAQVLLAELRFNAASFPGASNGVITAGAITADSSANATGTASWYRALQSDGTTVMWDGTVGTSGADLNLNSTAIQSGASVSVTSLTLTFPLT